MLPDMSDTLKEYEQDLVYHKITQTNENYKPVNNATISTIRAVVQVADPDKIKSDKVDFNKRYIMVHTSEDIDNNDRCIYKGLTYHAFILKDQQDYGFSEVIFEEVK